MTVSTEDADVDLTKGTHQERRLATKYALYPYVLISLAVVGSFFASLLIGYYRVASSEKFSEYGVPFIPAAADAGANPTPTEPAKLK